MVSKQVRFKEWLSLPEVTELIAASCSVFIMCCTNRGEQEPTGGLSLLGCGSEEGSKVSKSISCELLKASSVVTHHGSPAWTDTLPPSVSCFLSLSTFISYITLAYYTTARAHTPPHILYALHCVHMYHRAVSTCTCTHASHTHWSLSSTLLECSLVSAVMQSSPVISWELCVLHSLPSVLLFFLY